MQIKYNKGPKRAFGQDEKQLPSLYVRLSQKSFPERDRKTHFGEDRPTLITTLGSGQGRVSLSSGSLMARNLLCFLISRILIYYRKEMRKQENILETFQISNATFHKPYRMNIVISYIHSNGQNF